MPGPHEVEETTMHLHTEIHTTQPQNCVHFDSKHRRSAVQQEQLKKRKIRMIHTHRNTRVTKPQCSLWSFQPITLLVSAASDSDSDWWYVGGLTVYQTDYSFNHEAITGNKS